MTTRDRPFSHVGKQTSPTETDSQDSWTLGCPPTLHRTGHIFCLIAGMSDWTPARRTAQCVWDLHIFELVSNLVECLLFTASHHSNFIWMFVKVDCCCRRMSAAVPTRPAMLLLSEGLGSARWHRTFGVGARGSVCARGRGCKYVRLSRHVEYRP